MAIHPLFRDRPFEPEAITVMSGACADICDALGVNGRDLPARDAVAKAVIEFAQRGVNDRTRLCEQVLAALGSNGPPAADY